MSSNGDDYPKSDDELFRQAIANLDEEDIEEATSDDAGDGGDRLADELRKADVQPVEESDDAASSGGASGGRSSDGRAGRDEVSEREMFEQAIEGLSGEEMREQKFQEEAAERQAEQAREADEMSQSTSSDGGRREKTRHRVEFEAAMPDVDRIDKDQKHRAPSAPDPSSYFDDDSVGRTPEDFPTPTLPKSGEGLNDIPSLNDEQKEMIERAEAREERRGIPELNLRGQTADEAVSRLSDFVDQCRRQGCTFARIVPGRGKESKTEPVLKPAVLKWLETSGVDAIRGYAPERIFGGDYGSLIVEFLDG